MSQAQIENNFEYATNGLKIITVGRLSFEKGFDRLIRILKKLERDFEFELWILGEGPERQKLEDLIDSEKVESVKLLGYQNNPYAFLKKADLYVCSSLFEGYSTSVAEARILGVPVLTTECAGMDEILEKGKYGIIVENNDSALYCGLERVLTDPSLLDKFSLHDIRYTLDNATTEYERLFKEMLE